MQLCEVNKSGQNQHCGNRVHLCGSHWDYAKNIFNPKGPSQSAECGVLSTSSKDHGGLPVIFYFDLKNKQSEG